MLCNGESPDVHPTDPPAGRDTPKNWHAPNYPGMREWAADGSEGAAESDPIASRRSTCAQAGSAAADWGALSSGGAVI